MPGTSSRRPADRRRRRRPSPDPEAPDAPRRRHHGPEMVEVERHVPSRAAPPAAGSPRRGELAVRREEQPLHQRPRVRGGGRPPGSTPSRRPRPARPDPGRRTHARRPARSTTTNPRRRHPLARPRRRPVGERDRPQGHGRREARDAVEPRSSNAIAAGRARPGPPGPAGRTTASSPSPGPAGSASGPRGGPAAGRRPPIGLGGPLTGSTSLSRYSQTNWPLLRSSFFTVRGSRTTRTESSSTGKGGRSSQLGLAQGRPRDRAGRHRSAARGAGWAG